jgi:hypothetical protein
MKTTKPTDPFTGVWKFNHDHSTTSSPPPHSWTQRIEATAHEVTVREEIVSSEGAAPTVVEIQARFDGLEYPVTGSTAADTITYSRIDTHRISGTGIKNGRTTLRESLAVSPDGQTLTVNYSIYRGDRIVANGIAVFEKTEARQPRYSDSSEQ